MVRVSGSKVGSDCRWSPPPGRWRPWCRRWHAGPRTCPTWCRTCGPSQRCGRRPRWRARRPWRARPGPGRRRPRPCRCRGPRGPRVRQVPDLGALGTAEAGVELGGPLLALDVVEATADGGVVLVDLGDQVGLLAALVGGEGTALGRVVQGSEGGGRTLPGGPGGAEILSSGAHGAVSFRGRDGSPWTGAPKHQGLPRPPGWMGTRGSPPGDRVPIHVPTPGRGREGGAGSTPRRAEPGSESEGPTVPEELGGNGGPCISPAGVASRKRRWAGAGDAGGRKETPRLTPFRSAAAPVPDSGERTGAATGREMDGRTGGGSPST